MKRMFMSYEDIKALAADFDCCYILRLFNDTVSTSEGTQHKMKWKNNHEW